MRGASQKSCLSTHDMTIDSVQLTNQFCDVRVAKRPRITQQGLPDTTSSGNDWKPAYPNDTKLKQEQTIRRMVSLCNHFYARGLLDGIGSDVVVAAFGKDWKLHRIVLCNSTYFDALFCGSWKESDCEKIVPKSDDDYITEEAFRAVIARLYGRLDNLVNEQNVLNLLTTASYFGLQDFAWVCAEFMLQNLHSATIPIYLHFMESHSLGDISNSIVAGCFAALCRDGYDRLKPCWVQLPPEKFWPLMHFGLLLSMIAMSLQEICGLNEKH